MPCFSTLRKQIFGLGWFDSTYCKSQDNNLYRYVGPERRGLRRGAIGVQIAIARDGQIVMLFATNQNADGREHHELFDCAPTELDSLF